ncbi:MAG: GAF domain-containing protein [Alphaproteobacteria bacterium]|nr:GAF domain-containing protein [Alphaproteobacteria bacterium]
MLQSFGSQPIPQNEDLRLSTLHATKLLDSPEEEEYNAITRIAKAYFNTPVTLISLVDAKRQWFKAKCGLEASETPREISFCTHAIMKSNVMVVPDAAADKRFKENPLVKGEPNIRFYAGAPVIIPDGIILGTLCLIDTKPNPNFSKEDEAVLADMALLVASLAEHSLYKHAYLKQ